MQEKHFTYPTWSVLPFYWVSPVAGRAFARLYTLGREPFARLVAQGKERAKERDDVNFAILREP